MGQQQRHRLRPITQSADVQGGDALPFQIGSARHCLLDGRQVSPRDGVQQSQSSWRAACWWLAGCHQCVGRTSGGDARAGWEGSSLQLAHSARASAGLGAVTPRPAAAGSAEVREPRVVARARERLRCSCECVKDVRTKRRRAEQSKPAATSQSPAARPACRRHASRHARPPEQAALHHVAGAPAQPHTQMPHSPASLSLNSSSASLNPSSSL